MLFELPTLFDRMSYMLICMKGPQFGVLFELAVLYVDICMEGQKFGVVFAFTMSERFTVCYSFSNLVAHVHISDSDCSLNL